MRLLICALLATSFFAVGCAHHGKHHQKVHKKHWKMMDANNDGEVTRKEFDEGHDKIWSNMDSNDDGKITKEERQAYYGKKKKGCGCGDKDS